MDVIHTYISGPNGNRGNYIYIYIYIFFFKFRSRYIMYYHLLFKGAMYIIWCGVNRLGDSGVKVV